MGVASGDESKTLVVGRPNVVDAKGFLEDVEVILSSRLLTNNGPFAIQLEEAAREYLGAAHVVAVSNATMGLELALRALGLRPGSEVLVPSFTFVATAHAIVAAGLVPVFCDVDEATHFVSIASAARAATARTAAVVAVHLWGAAGDADALEAFAAERRLAVVYDSAHAFGARYADGRRVGTRGTAEVFSLHATKLLNGFEGGLIATSDDALADSISQRRNFGFGGQDLITVFGTNAKLSDVHAALALRHLRKIDATLDHYRRVARAYDAALRDRGLCPGPLAYWNADKLDEASGCTHSYVCVRVAPAFGLSRDALMAALRKRAIYAKRYFFPGVHRHAPYAPYAPPDASLALRTTDVLNGELLVLPTGTDVTEADVRHVVDAIRAVYDARDATCHTDVKVRPSDCDWSYYDTVLVNIDTERSALQAKLAELDKAEAIVRHNRAIVAERVCSSDDARPSP